MTSLILVGTVLAVQSALTIRSLYLTDLQWGWELYLTTSYLAKFLLPVALLAGFLAWRGWRLARRQPMEYGGLRLSRHGLALSLTVGLLNGGALIARVPDMLENRRLKQQAYTEAMMYKLNVTIARYREQFGSYPERLIDLQELDPNIKPVLDYWDHAFVYTPMSAEVASRVSPVPFQNYELISRGRDGVLGTPDDMVMRDGFLIPFHSAETFKEKSPGRLEK